LYCALFVLVEELTTLKLTQFQVKHLVRLLKHFVSLVIISDSPPFFFKHHLIGFFNSFQQKRLSRVNPAHLKKKKLFSYKYFFWQRTKLNLAWSFAHQVNCGFNKFLVFKFTEKD